MATLTDILAQTVASATKGVEIPSNVQNTVLNGLSDSVIKGLTQTATSPGGLNALKDLFSGKTSASSSPVTSLATSIFTKNTLSKLGLGNSTNAALAGLLPGIISKVSGLFKDMDGDGDIDLNDIILALSGAQPKKSSTSSILGNAASSILGGLFK